MEYNSKVFVPILLVIVLFNAVKSDCPAEKDEAWSYNAKLKNGPEYWGETYSNCYGRRQSPVNIVKAEVITDQNLQKLQLTNYDKPVAQFDVENNGHTVRVTPKDGVKRSVFVNETTYVLDHFHFHWGDKYSRGSEHTIDDKQYVMEVHFVHLDERGRIAVVGVFYKESVLSNNRLSPITNSLSRVLYRGDKMESITSFRLDKLVDNDCSIYRYEGSLTTPGCDEGVLWSICKEPKNIGFLQISEFRKLYSVRKSEEKNDCKITNNFRPIQPLNGRIISSSQ